MLDLLGLLSVKAIVDHWIALFLEVVCRNGWWFDPANRNQARGPIDHNVVCFVNLCSTQLSAPLSMDELAAFSLSCN